MSSNKETKKEVTPYQELLEQNQALLNQNQLLQNELQSLKIRLADAEELKRAISEGDLDAFVIQSTEGELIFTLNSADSAYRALVETMNEGTVTLAFDGTILYCNHQFAELLRMSPQRIVGSSIRRFIEPGYAAIFEALLKRGKGSGEISLQAANGASVPVYLSISSLKEEESPNAWQLVFTDLTEQKKSEEIIAAERLARSIIEQAAEAIIVCDVSGRIIRFSNSASKFCGFNPLFQRFEDIIDLRYSEGAYAGKRILPISSALSGSTILGVEVTFEPTNCQRFNLLLNSGSLKNNNGEIIGCIVTLTDMTEKKRLEEKVLAKEAELQLITDVTPVILNRLNRDLKFVFVNRACAEMFGLTREEIIGKPIVEILGEDAFEMTRPYVEQVLQGQRVEFETEIPYKGISSRFMQVTYIPERNVQGEVVGWLASIMDITERKQIEEALRESEERLRLLGDNLPDSAVYQYIHELDGSVRFLYFSTGIERLNGISVSDVLCDPGTLHRQIPSEYFERLVEAETKSANELSDFDMETSMQLPDGQIRWMRLHSRPRRLPDGQTIWDGVQIDITERKQAEEALQLSEKKFAMAFANNPAAIALTLLEDGRFLDVNDTWVDLNGYSRDEAIGNFARTMHIWPTPEEAARFVQELQEKGSLYGWEQEFYNKSGKIFTAQLSAQILTINGEKVILSTLVDITERKQAEEALQASEERYRAFFENSIDAVLLASPDGNISAANRAAQQIFGMTEGEIIQAGRNGIVDLFDPRLKPALEERERTGKFKGELNYKRKDGTVFPGEVSTTLFKDKNGSVKTVMIIRDITERKRAEEEREHLLREVEEQRTQLQTILNSLPVGVWVSDAMGKMLMVNEAASTIYGGKASKADNLEGYSAYKVWWPETGEQIPVGDYPLPRALKGETVKDMVMDHERFDGTRGSHITSSTPLRDSQGNIIGGIVVAMDITERKKAEEALRKSEERLKLAQEGAHIGTFDWNIQTGVNIWSPQLEAMYGLPPGGFAKTQPAWESLVYPDDRAQAVKLVEHTLKTGAPVDGEWRVQWPDGSIHWISGRFQVFKDESGKPIRMTGINIDITERKRAEEALKKSEEKYRLLYEKMLDGFIIVGMDGFIQEYNNAYKEMLGYSDAELKNLTYSDITPEKWHAFEARIVEEEIVAKGYSGIYEKEYRRKDGTIIPIELRTHLIRDASGQPAGMWGIVRDITERKKAEEALKIANETLEARVQERTEELNIAYESLRSLEIVRKQEIHHRIKNNLQVISSLLDLQAETFRGKKNIEDSQILEAFRESQDRVISMALIHEELHKGGKLDTLNISRYIEELANNLFLTYRLGNESTSLNTDIEEDIFFDMDISVPLGMIINELISNSLKHAFFDREKGEIQIKLKKEKNGEYEREDCNSAYVLMISDNGVGIPENLDIEDIDSLGMQLVISLVDQLDGEFELKRNNGTEFIIRFTVK